MNKNINEPKIFYEFKNYHPKSLNNLIHIMATAKKTIVNTMAYLGAAISEGQPKRGVERAPDEYRRVGLFDGLRKKYPINKINDYGNISL